MHDGSTGSEAAVAVLTSHVDAVRHRRTGANSPSTAVGVAALRSKAGE